MKKHLGQLQNGKGRCGRPEQSDVGVPSWVPPAPALDQIDRMEREKSRRKRPPADRPRVEIDMEDPAEQDPRRKDEDEEGRGIAIIEL
ncbi:hypothetical protein L0Y65_06760 [Candidatus Micrarchaeota archaeon]|nr:hypothetical protein [Candidatus Micrarchaeota archaeon]